MGVGATIGIPQLQLWFCENCNFQYNNNTHNHDTLQVHTFINKRRLSAKWNAEYKGVDLPVPSLVDIDSRSQNWQCYVRPKVPLVQTWDWEPQSAIMPVWCSHQLASKEQSHPVSVRKTDHSSVLWIRFRCAEMDSDRTLRNGGTAVQSVDSLP